MRQIWGVDEPKAGAEQRKPLRRVSRPSAAPVDQTDDRLRLRLAEELDYARRMLEITGDALSSDRIAVSRHAVAMQSLDIVGQMLGHIANIVRSSDPDSAVEEIGMGDLKARLTRHGAL